MTTHLRTIIFVLGAAFGVVFAEKSLYATELVIFSMFVFVAEFAVYLFSSKKGSPSLVALCLTLVSLGAMVGGVRTQFVQEPTVVVCEQACRVEGTVTRKTITKDVYQVFDVDVGGHSAYVRVRSPLYPEYMLGDRVALYGVVDRPKNRPSHKNEQSFDYVSYLRVHNVGSEMYFPKVEIVEAVGEKTLYFSLRVFQEHLVERVTTYISKPAAYLASGMLLGVTNFSQEMTDMFRVAGLSHIVVLSGFNVTILIVFVLLLLRPLPVLMRGVTAALVVVLFVVMVGGGASLVRASLMAGISLCALIFGRGYIAHQALILSFFVIIMYSPLSLLYDVSLHLSFLATCGIVYGYSFFKTLFSKYMNSVVGDTLSSTIAAYMATLPYILYTFGSLSLYAIPANLIVLPLVPVTMSFTLLTLTMSFISSYAATLLGLVTSVLANIIVYGAKVVSGLPFSQIGLHLSFFSMVSVYVVMIAVIAFFRTRDENETTETKEGEIISPIMRF